MAMKVQLIVSQRNVDELGLTLGGQIPSIPLMGGISAALGYSVEYTVTAPSISSRIRAIGGDREVAIQRAKDQIREFIGKAEVVEVEV